MLIPFFSFKYTHIAAVEGQLEEVRGTISHHVLESIIIQPKILQVEVEKEKEGKS